MFPSFDQCRHLLDYHTLGFECTRGRRNRPRINVWTAALKIIFYFILFEEDERGREGRGVAVEKRFCGSKTEQYGKGDGVISLFGCDVSGDNCLATVCTCSVLFYLARKIIYCFASFFVF